MTKFLTPFFFSIIFMTLSGTAAACGNDGGQFLNNLRPILTETSLQTFYINFGGSLEGLNQALSGHPVRSDLGSKKEPVFRSVTEALSAKKAGTTYVLGFNQAESRLQSVYDARTGQPLIIISPKGCGSMRVAAQ